MPVLNTIKGSTRTSRYGNATFECGDAQLRAHYRHLATVVAVHGGIDATNVDELSDRARRFILAKEPLVLDLSDVDEFAPAGLWLLCVLDGDCRVAGIEWTLIASPAVSSVLRDFDEEAKFPTAPSVSQALHTLANVIDLRRQLLMPLINKKTA